MSFPKFSEWVLVKEQVGVQPGAPTGNPPADKENDALLQQIAGLSGPSRATKLKQLSAKILANKAIDPKKRAGQLAIVNAAGEDS